MSEAGKIIFRTHAVKRMFQRRVDEKDVRSVLETGEIIEVYPDDTPYPSRLILGWLESRPLHVVAADNIADNEQLLLPFTNLSKTNGASILKGESHEMRHLQTR